MGQGVLEPLLISVGAKGEAQERQQLPPAPGAGEGKNLFPTFGGAQTKRSAQLTCAGFNFTSCVMGFLYPAFSWRNKRILCILLYQSKFCTEVK